MNRQIDNSSSEPVALDSHGRKVIRTIHNKFFTNVTELYFCVYLVDFIAMKKVMPNFV